MHDFYIRPTYWNFVTSEASLINSDGCSKVLGFRRECCDEHDLGYFHGRDPHDAYIRFRGGSIEPWKDARSISRAEVDRRFRRCHQRRSKFGIYSPMAVWRWLGVRLGGASIWSQHRLVRPQ